MDSIPREGLWGLVGGAITLGVPAVWRLLVGRSQHRQGWLEAELERERKAKETVIAKLEAAEKENKRLTSFSVAVWTSYRDRCRAEADAYRKEMPSVVGVIADAVTKDPELDKELKAFIETPKPPK